jgi:hypothetical protein
MPSPRSSPRILASVLITAATVLGGVALIPTPSYATAAAPTVTKLSVAKGSTAGGTPVVITGTGFSTVVTSTASSVTFGGVNATSFLVTSDTSMSAVAPAGTGAANTGQVDVLVTNPTGTSAVSAADKFAYRAPITATAPTGTLLNPVAGSVITVGVNITLTGSSNFSLESITGTIGGAAATVAYADSSHVTMTVPAGTPSNTPTTVALIHDTITGTPDTTHARYAAVISSLSRKAGPIAGGGGTITVTGKGFTNGSDWKFGANDATCSVTTDTSASCTVIPAQAASDPVQATVPVTFTPAGSTPFGTTSGGAYTYSDIS